MTFPPIAESPSTSWRADRLRPCSVGFSAEPLGRHLIIRRRGSRLSAVDWPVTSSGPERQVRAQPLGRPEGPPEGDDVPPPEAQVEQHDEHGDDRHVAQPRPSRPRPPRPEVPGQERYRIHVPRSLRQQPEPGGETHIHDVTRRLLDQPVPHDQVRQAHHPERHDVVVLRARRLQDPHRDAQGDRRGQQLRLAAPAEVARRWPRPRSAIQPC